MSTISVVEGEDLLVYFDGEDESPKSDVMKTKKPGGDLLVYLEGVDVVYFYQGNLVTRYY
jgi:hypothetical protein